MNIIMVVTRDELIDLIEAAIERTPSIGQRIPVTGANRTKLRAVGISAREVEVASFGVITRGCGCPATQAGMFNRDSGDRTPDTDGFAAAFDNEVRKLWTADPGRDVPDDFPTLLRVEA